MVIDVIGQKPRHMTTARCQTDIEGGEDLDRVLHICDTLMAEAPPPSQVLVVGVEKPFLVPPGDEEDARELANPQDIMRITYLAGGLIGTFHFMGYTVVEVLPWRAKMAVGANPTDEKDRIHELVKRLWGYDAPSHHASDAFAVAMAAASEKHWQDVPKGET